MIKVDGYKAFRGVMRIIPQRLGWEVFEVEGDWLYKPETDCWYNNGKGYERNMCQVLKDYMEADCNTVKCEDCIYMYHCNRTYLGGCDTGIEWGKANVAEVVGEKINPKIGETVYIIIKNEIFEKKVFAITKDGFIAKDDGVLENRLSDYDKDWFYELDKAKEKIIDELGDDCEIVQGDKDWWYVER